METVSNFAEHFMLNAARLWTDSSSDQKQRLQKVLFPQGVTFDNGNYRTAETCLFFKLLSDSEVEKTSLATLPGIEPGLPFHKADTHKSLYYQHNQTRLTWADFSTILALYGKHTSKTSLTLLARFISRPGWPMDFALHKMRRPHQGDVRCP